MSRDQHNGHQHVLRHCVTNIQNGSPQERNYLKKKKSNGFSDTIIHEDDFLFF